MLQSEVMPVDMKVLTEQIYQYKKGVRHLSLYTFNKKYRKAAILKLQHQNINYIIQPVNDTSINLFFGKKECLDAIAPMLERPLCKLSAEEDFILGTLLGYDVCVQCERYCSLRKKK
ncbi:MAG: DUF2023 family protein [Bacteroidales bacterium]|nr:DUF2023 family protein [Bacteroidales bacterium]